MGNYPSYTDQVLAGLLKAGDRLAYAEIYDRYIASLLAHAYNKCRDKEEAKDAVQEVFTMLWTKRENIREDQNLGGFLYTATRNVILNQINRQGIHARYLDTLELPDQSVTDHRVREKELRAIIEREIAALPPKMREVFELSRKEHLSYQEIADRLGLSPQTVNKQVSNALKILRVKLGLYAYLLFIICPR